MITAQFFHFAYWSMDYSLKYGGFSRPTATSRIASPGYAPYDGATRKETRSEGLQGSIKRRQTKFLADQAERAQHVVNKSLSDGKSVGDVEIQYLYTLIKSNVLRVARTYFNGVIPTLPDNNSDSRSTGDGEPHELVSIDRRKQVEFFSNWSTRGEIRVFRVSGKIFEIMYERIFKARCFGGKLDEEERLADSEAGLQDSTGQCSFPHKGMANI